MTVVNRFKTKEFHVVEFIKDVGERYTIALTDPHGAPIHGFFPTNLCVTKGVFETINPDGSVWVRHTPMVARNWLEDGSGSIELHILEAIHCYCASPREEGVSWVGYGHFLQTGEGFQMPAFAHPQRLFLCKGEMKEPSGAARTELFIWTVEPNDTPKFIAQTDCILMRLVGLPSADDVPAYLVAHPDSSSIGEGI